METSTSALVRAYGSSLRAEPATILVAENHDSVRMVVREILESRGYNVLIGRDGSEAIRHIATHPGRLDLLLTDLVLPELNGRQLSDRGRALRSDLRTLYMSGYSPMCLMALGLDASPYLQKPFTPDELIQHIEHTLSIPQYLWSAGRMPLGLRHCQQAAPLKSTAFQPVQE